MTDSAAVRSFIAKWEQNTQQESAAAKEHFAELCHLVGVPTPNDPGSGPDSYCFERSLTKTGGKAGFADVCKRDCFAWEYKGKYASLDAAYSQLLLYKEDLGNASTRELVRLRDEWLGGDDEGRTTNDESDSVQPSSLVVRPSSLKDRTLTNLYNKHPDWLAEAHRNLDAAVFAAYGWPPALSDDEILARLLALNLARAAVQARLSTARVEQIEETDE